MVSNVPGLEAGGNAKGCFVYQGVVNASLTAVRPSTTHILDSGRARLRIGLPG
jgi:hypothetical protein